MKFIPRVYHLIFSTIALIFLLFGSIFLFLQSKKYPFPDIAFYHLDLKITPTPTINSTPVENVPITETPAGSAISTKNKQAVPQSNYQLFPCEDGTEGCYSMKDSPKEPMTSIQELNYSLNQYRKSHGLNILTIDPQICEVANLRSREIEQDFSHNGFRIHIENGDYSHIGFSVIAENLWQGSFSGVHIIEYGWDKSPGHRSNLLGNWSRGCAGVYGENAVFIFVK